MIELLIEIISQVAGELFLYYFADRVAWEGGRSTLVAGLGHALAGAILGSATLVLLPHHFIASPRAQVAVLIAVPAALGAIFAAREMQGDRPDARPAHRFVTTAALAIGFGVVRYLFAK